MQHLQEHDAHCERLSSAYMTIAQDRSGQGFQSALLLLLGMLPSAVVVRSPDDIILHWNDGATKLYGWTASEAVGKSSTALLFTRLPVPESSLAADLSRLGCWGGSVSRLRRDGQRIDVEYRAALIGGMEPFDALHIEVTSGQVVPAESPALHTTRTPALETLVGNIRGLKAANAALTKENEVLRTAAEQAVQRERRRVTLLAEENARLRNVLAQICALMLPVHQLTSSVPPSLGSANSPH